MAKNSSDLLEFLVRVDRANVNSLAQIRHFENLKMAHSDTHIWLSGFSMEQIHSADVKTLPKKDLFYVKQNKLFPKDSLLPIGQLPTSLLWTPIQKALLLESPELNHNFFGIQEKIVIQIVPCSEEKKTYANLVNLDTYSASIIESSPNFRLQPLSYTIINNSKLLILGHPTLPIKGQSFWLHHDFLIPNGYHFKFPILTKSIKQRLNPSSGYFVLWQKNNSYALLKKSELKPLSISSFRRTIRLLDTDA